MAARSASIHYDRFKNYKQRKLEEGKPWPIARNNLVNKSITIICAIWNSGEFYDPDHTSRFDRENVVTANRFFAYSIYPLLCKEERRGGYL